MEPTDIKEIKIAQARVPLALHKAADKLLTDNESSFQELIVNAIREYVGKHSPEVREEADRVQLADSELGARVRELISKRTNDPLYASVLAALRQLLKVDEDQ